MTEIDRFQMEIMPFAYGGGREREWHIHVEYNGRKYHYTTLMPRIRLHSTELELYIRAAVQEFRKVDADA